MTGEQQFEPEVPPVREPPELPEVRSGDLNEKQAEMVRNTIEELAKEYAPEQQQQLIKSVMDLYNDTKGRLGPEDRWSFDRSMANVKKAITGIGKNSL
jgi:hypothetical protein